MDIPRRAGQDLAGTKTQGGRAVAPLVRRLARFANSPKGRELTQKATEKVKQVADRPENRRRIEDLRRRVTSRGERTGGGERVDRPT